MSKTSRRAELSGQKTGGCEDPVPIMFEITSAVALPNSELAKQA